MAHTTDGNPDLTAKRRQWQEWARRKIGGSEEQISVAANAAMDAAQAGATSEEAAAAARAAVKETIDSSLDSQSAQSRPEMLGPAPAGMILGWARKVQRQQQLTQGGAIIILEFNLERSGAEPIYVQMRGQILDGVIRDGDVVSIPEKSVRGNFAETRRIFNRTTNVPVQMRAGIGGAYRVMEAHLGTGLARLKVAGMVLLFLIVGIVIIVFVMKFGLPWEPPDGWCDGAERSGWENPPGC